MKINILILVLLCNLSLYANTICIKNFNKELCGNFGLLNSVIIKSVLSKNELQKKLNKEVKQIAFLENSNLYLVSSNSSLSYAKELSKKEFIIYAQPNIVQSLNKSKYNSHNVIEKYNLKKIWQVTKGEGVNIAIIDDGFDLNHEDLKGVKVLFSYDSDYKNLNSFPKVNLDKHGTKVAGVIFAQHNQKGISGIAPNAGFIPIRQTKNITSDTILSFTIANKANADIINCSWNSPYLLEPVYDTIKHIAKTKAVVFAAGNEGKKLKPFSTEASILEVITVGAKAKYSNYGDIVDFVIPSSIYTTKVEDNYGKFSGTSATAPVITGLLALNISQYPNKPMHEIVNILKKEINEN